MSIDRSGLGTIVNIATSSATLDANVELSGGNIRLKSNGTSTTTGCTYNSAGSNSATQATGYNAGANIISAPGVAHANIFTLSNYLSVSQVTLRLRRSGTPSGNMRVKLRTSSAGVPAATVLGTSSDVLISTASSSMSGGDITFSFASNVELVNGSSPALVLEQSTSAFVDGSNNFRWVVANGAGCTAFPTYQRSTDGAVSWSTGTASSPSFFSFVAETHATTGTAEWVLTAESGATWNLVDFDMNEDPRLLGSGTIRYDIDVGESPTSPGSYSYTNLTEAGVRAMSPSTLTGTYLYVRANFSVSAPGFDQAELGNGTITYR